MKNRLTKYLLSANGSAANLQLFFLGVPLVYLLVLTTLVVYRSSNRSSVLSDGNGFTAQVGEALGDAAAIASSKVQLEDFHRVEIKAGKVVWEVNAKDAKYYPKDSVIHVNGVALRVFDQKHEAIDVQAEAAKLYRSETSLNRAVLDGNILINLGGGMSVKTESAEFDAQERVFQSAGKVEINGEGFQVYGEGFRFFVESGILSFAKDVHCSFKDGAELPKSVRGGV